jgi:uncharacterized protein
MPFALSAPRQIRALLSSTTCWDYNDGLFEVRLGKALKDGYRQKAFVMTKLDARTAKDYDKQVEQSMGRLDTDVIDLVQFHEILRFEDPDRIFAEDGAIHAAIAARAAGKICTSASRPQRSPGSPSNVRGRGTEWISL